MPTATSVADLDLSPKAGKIYFNTEREWREEFIYFLLVDRFHDDQVRHAAPQAGRSAGIPAGKLFYGGTLRGVKNNLDYIAGLGCTAIWLSPIFENNPDAYHGYDINNYLEVDPHFGTKQDLIDLVDAAHTFTLNGNPWPIRVILDVVINHSGNNWTYPGDVPYYYSNDQRFDFGNWRRNDRPVPNDLRDPECYHRKGQITGGGWDQYPQRQHGDIDLLKDYANDDDAIGSKVINALIKSHCYWIREADVDGFRVDAVKHMGELACSIFSSGVREYAYSLGKRGFFLFGEVATPEEDLLDRYIGQNTSKQDGEKTVFFGLNSVLDFRLAEGRYGDDDTAPLRDVLLGKKGPQTLFNRLDAQRYRALNRGEVGRYLVTFVDNHDHFWQPGRFASLANDDQVIGAVGFLLCALGTPCLYYGTEQGFSGQGNNDEAIREAMFDVATPGSNSLNTACRIYGEIAKIAAVMRREQPLRFGRMYYREISGDGLTFGLPYGSDYTLAFSRLLYGHEVLVAYNVSSNPRNDHVVIDFNYHQRGEHLQILYGGTGSVAVDGTIIRSVQLNLAPHQFVILA